MHTYDFGVELVDTSGEYFVDTRRIHERYKSETSAHHQKNIDTPAEYTSDAVSDATEMSIYNHAAMLDVYLESGLKV